jgi:hypothetical protein
MLDGTTGRSRGFGFVTFRASQTHSVANSRRRPLTGTDEEVDKVINATHIISGKSVECVPSMRVVVPYMSPVAGGPSLNLKCPILGASVSSATVSETAIAVRLHEARCLLR